MSDYWSFCFSSWLAGVVWTDSARDGLSPAPGWISPAGTAWDSRTRGSSPPGRRTLARWAPARGSPGLWGMGCRPPACCTTRSPGSRLSDSPPGIWTMQWSAMFIWHSTFSELTTFSRWMSLSVDSPDYQSVLTDHQTENETHQRLWQTSLSTIMWLLWASFLWKHHARVVFTRPWTFSTDCDWLWLLLLRPAVPNPLRRWVLPGPLELTVVLALHQQTRPEVNDGDGPSAWFDDHVLVLDVAMQDARLVTADDGLQYLDLELRAILLDRSQISPWRRYSYWEAQRGCPDWRWSRTDPALCTSPSRCRKCPGSRASQWWWPLQGCPSPAAGWWSTIEVGSDPADCSVLSLTSRGTSSQLTFILLFSTSLIATFSPSLFLTAP